jgi:hypothetical protein
MYSTDVGPTVPAVSATDTVVHPFFWAVFDSLTLNFAPSAYIAAVHLHRHHKTRQQKYPVRSLTSLGAMALVLPS